MKQTANVPYIKSWGGKYTWPTPVLMFWENYGMYKQDTLPLARLANLSEQSSSQNDWKTNL